MKLEMKIMRPLKCRECWECDTNRLVIGDSKDVNAHGTLQV